MLFRIELQLQPDAKHPALDCKEWCSHVGKGPPRNEELWQPACPFLGLQHPNPAQLHPDQIQLCNGEGC